MPDQETAIPTIRKRTPWNKGKLTGAKPPLRPKHVWSIRTKLQIEGRVRDLAMFNLAIDSKLRGCDVVAIKVDDVAAGGYTADRATLRQKKTGRPVRFELTEQTRQAVDEYLRATNKKPGEFLFAGRRGPQKSITTRQYARLVSDWIGSVGLDPRLYGTHSLRRTKATLIYRRTGNLRAVQLLLGHTKIESKHPLWAAGIPVASGVRIISANGGQAPDPNARASRRLTRPHVESRGRAYLPIIPVDESADDQPVDICRASGSRGKASHSVPTMAGACAASDAIGNKRAETRRRVRRRARSFRSANSTAAARRGR